MWRFVAVVLLGLLCCVAADAIAQDSLNVRRVGQLNMGDAANCVTVVDTLAYVGIGFSTGAPGVMRIVDVSDPANPQQIGFLNMGNAARDIAVSGNYAYVASYTNGLRIINISNPAAPTETGFYDTPGQSEGVAVSGNYAYVADCFFGLRVINIANPAFPIEVGFYDTPLCAYDVAVSGNYAYLANYNGGFRIFDISNPAAPTHVGFYAMSWATEVEITGDYAYVADDFNGLRVISVSNPSAPTQVGSIQFQNDALGVALSGNYAYVVVSTSGLRVINIINPAVPEEVGFYNTPGVALGVAAVDNIAYVADRYSFGIYDFSEPIVPEINVTPSSLEFGNVQVGHDSVRLLTIENTGGAPLTVTEMTVPAGFVQLFSLPLTIAVGDSATDSVRFSPTGEWLYRDNLVITSDAPSSPTNVLVSGRGALPEIHVIPTTLAFGNVPVEQDSVRLLTIQNTGAAPLTVTEMTVPTGFAHLFSLPLTIAMDDSVTDSVRFGPTAEQPYSGNLVIISNARISPTMVLVSGIGVLPSSAEHPSPGLFKDFHLGQNYPNPFNSTAMITLDLPNQLRGRLVAYDALGREVRTLIDGTMQAGSHDISFDGTGLSSGNYFVRFESPQFSAVQKAVLVK